MTIRITCIKKSGGYHQDPHHAIESVGWISDDTGKHGTSDRLTIYDWIKNKKGSAYVQDAQKNRASVGTRENTNGTKYLQTHADKIWTDNLLSLPECR
jgi:hypothetical protein